jgi:8-oxo-dGTP diphosphatase
MEPVVKAGVGVIVIKGNKILVGKRKGSHGEGLWSFPGGHIDPTDDSLKACGEREVLEETGIVCNVYNPDGIRQDLFTNFKILSEDLSKRYVTCYLIATYVSGGTGSEDFIQPLEPNKCEGWYWRELEELQELIKDENAKSWIPIDEISEYLNEEDAIYRLDELNFNIWDDYNEEEENVSTCGFFENEPTDAHPVHFFEEAAKKIFECIKLIELNGVELSCEEDSMIFRNLSHENRQRLVEELREMNLEFRGIPIKVYSES